MPRSVGSLSLSSSPPAPRRRPRVFMWFAARFQILSSQTLNNSRSDIGGCPMRDRQTDSVQQDLKWRLGGLRSEQRPRHLTPPPHLVSMQARMPQKRRGCSPPQPIPTSHLTHSEGRRACTHTCPCFFVPSAASGPAVAN